MPDFQIGTPALQRSTDGLVFNVHKGLACTQVLTVDNLKLLAGGPPPVSTQPQFAFYCNTNGQPVMWLRVLPTNTPAGLQFANAPLVATNPGIRLTSVQLFSVNNFYFRVRLNGAAPLTDAASGHALGVDTHRCWFLMAAPSCNDRNMSRIPTRRWAAGSGFGQAPSPCGPGCEKCIAYYGGTAVRARNGHGI